MLCRSYVLFGGGMVTLNADNDLQGGVNDEVLSGGSGSLGSYVGAGGTGDTAMERFKLRQTYRSIL